MTLYVVTLTAFDQFLLALGVSPVPPLMRVADSDHRAMDTAESRLRECKQIAARLKEEMEQKAQHSRTADQGTTAMDTSSSSAPPQVGPTDMVASPTSNTVRSCRLLISPRPPLPPSTADSLQWTYPREQHIMRCAGHV